MFAKATGVIITTGVYVRLDHVHLVGRHGHTHEIEDPVCASREGIGPGTDT